MRHSSFVRWLCGRSTAATAVTCGLLAAVLSAAQRPPALDARFPPPDGFRIVDDDRETGTADFALARGVRGQILRRTLEAPESASTTAVATARHFAARVRAQGGTVHEDRLNAEGGRLDGYVPGERPVWLHVDITDAGRSVALVALEQDANPPALSRPVEEIAIPGTWSTADNLYTMTAAGRSVALPIRDGVARAWAPFFQPLIGWAWRVSLEDLPDVNIAPTQAFPYRLHVFGLTRSQDCPACPVITDTHGRTLVRLDINRVEALGERDQATLKADGFFLTPAVTEATGQISRFDEGRRRLVVRPGRPPLYLPVTREAYLQARIRFVTETGGGAASDMNAAVAEFEAAMKELEKTNPAAARQARAEFAASRKLMTSQTSEGAGALRDELAGLSADARRAPATDPVGRPVARINPAYFEPGRPAAAAHFVVVDVPALYGVGELSLYQFDVLERVLARAVFTDLVK